MTQLTTNATTLALLLLRLLWVVRSFPQVMLLPSRQDDWIRTTTTSTTIPLYKNDGGVLPTDFMALGSPSGVAERQQHHSPMLPLRSSSVTVLGPFVERKNRPYVFPFQKVAQTTTAGAASNSTSKLSVRNMAQWSQRARATLQSTAKEWWWMCPMALAVLPAYRWLVHNGAATVTPAWWKMTCMEYIRASPHAVMVVSVFLLSNISYFGVGALFFWLSHQSRTTSSNSMTPQLLRGGSSAEELLRSLLAGQQRPKQQPSRQQPPQQHYVDLGCWIVACGAVSTLFHALQALGDPLLAEAACFVDHGVALTSILYFWHTCGSPLQRKRVWIPGLAGLVTLSLPLRPGYAFLHSSWHVLSAVAALFWGFQKKQQQRPRRQTSFSATRATPMILVEPAPVVPTTPVVPLFHLQQQPPNHHLANNKNMTLSYYGN